jgi:hypothetical protein
VRAVDAQVFFECPLNLGLELLIAKRACRLKLWVGLPSLVCVLARRTQRQLGAMRLDPKPVLVLIDKGDHFFNWRSSSAWAKKADAVFRISLARRSSLTSRLSAFISSPLPVLSPFRRPSSMSAYLTQRRNGSVVQPIFSATEQVAAQRDECSCNACSNSRTARSLTSGEYRFVFMTPVSQLLESPGNPGRFNAF